MIVNDSEMRMRWNNEAVSKLSNTETYFRDDIINYNNNTNNNIQLL